MRVLQTTTTDNSDRYYSDPPTLCVGGPLIINRTIKAIKKFIAQQLYK